jgi:hypothetical protein
MRRASPRFIRPAPLAGSLLLILAPAIAAHADDSAIAPEADATGMTIAVKNCNDSGPGSLRAAVTGALSGDTIDMRGLSCRRINLTSGAIMIPQDDLTFMGGGITVDANNTSSVFRHNGTGWLRIRGMTIARGFHFDDDETANGGCVYSAGSIELTYALVHWCTARSTGFPLESVGGGLYADGAVTLTDSHVLGNTAHTGGGIFTRGHLKAYRSRICDNHAPLNRDSSGGAYAGDGLEAYGSTFSGNTGGALGAIGDTTIANSTISGNRATSGFRFTPTIWVSSVFGSTIPSQTSIINSTISGNLSTIWTLRLGSEVTTIINSTIAFNDHKGYVPSRERCSRYSTVHLFRGTVASLHIESSIIANNTCNGNPYRDVGGTRVTGANNLITLSNLPLPPDTISLDPRLAPLADNGGRTKTHALLDDSPAIDMGNNAAGLEYDQRGPGFPRVKGPQADIGAYER